MHATTMPLYQAKHPENQSLIDALLELAEVETHSNIRKAGFRARALRMAAQNLATVMNEKITSGQDVAAAGPKKVKGVGKGTAYYIDEFLETGRSFRKLKKSKPIQKSRAEKKNKQRPPSVAEEPESDMATKSLTDTLQIPRI
jgi:DNA polymerase/3'-5' exonuclease PolX